MECFDSSEAGPTPEHIRTWGVPMLPRQDIISLVGVMVFSVPVESIRVAETAFLPEKFMRETRWEGRMVRPGVGEPEESR